MGIENIVDEILAKALLDAAGVPDENFESVKILVHGFRELINREIDKGECTTAVLGSSIHHIINLIEKVIPGFRSKMALALVTEEIKKQFGGDK